MSATPRERFLGGNSGVQVDALAVIQIDPTPMGSVARPGGVGQRIQ
jgi:hypothetical protein